MNNLMGYKMDALFNWKRRALKAENKLHQLGVETPSSEVSDDFYLVNTLEKKDGSTVHMDELNAARDRQGR